MRAWVHGPAQALLGKNQPTCSDNVGRAGRSVLASLLPLEKCRRPGSERPMALPYLLLVSGECRCTHRVVCSRCQHTERSKETPRLKTTAEILAPTDPPAKSVFAATTRCVLRKGERTQNTFRALSPDVGRATQAQWPYSGEIPTPPSSERVG